LMLFVQGPFSMPRMPLNRAFLLIIADVHEVKGLIVLRPESTAHARPDSQPGE